MDTGETTARSQPMFGVYDILDTIGQGGMGIVYRAHDTALDRVVALKVLKEDLRGNKQIAARFQREAQAFASLNHPNIVHIYSVGSVGRIPYFAMEYVDGVPLSRVMKQERKLEWERAIGIVEQVADALATAHEHHIVHRDIKPSNILLDKSGQAFVTDFGIAKVLTAETQLTVDGSRLGTPQYMSPERCMNKTVTPSSDLYSVGVMCFQMITGRLPYESENTVELIKRIVTDPPKRLSEYVEGVPRDVERLVAYLLEKKPQDRPADAGELATLCRRLLEGEPLFPESTAASSLREFRETETPITSSTTGFTQQRDRLLEMWLGLSVPGRMWLVAAPLIALAGMAGVVVGNAANDGYEPVVTRRWDSGIGAWTRPSEPASFRAESAAASLVSVNLPGHSVAAIEAAGGSRFAVSLREGGETAVLYVDPGKETARLTRGRADAMGLTAGIRYLGAAGVGGESFYAYGDGEVRRGDPISDSGSDGSLVIAAEDLEAYAATPVAEILAVEAVGGDGGGYLVTAESRGGEAQLIYVSRDTDGSIAGRLLGGPAEAVGSVHASESGAVLFSVRKDGVDQIVRVASPSRSEKVTMMEMDASTRRVVSVNDRYALVVEQDGEARTLLMVDLLTQEPVALGEGESGILLDDAGVALIVAADRRGDLQVWRVSREAPEERAQKTFIAGGIRGLFDASADGAFALCALPGDAVPELLAVRLEAGAEGL